MSDTYSLTVPGTSNARTSISFSENPLVLPYNVASPCVHGENDNPIILKL